jgi:hypothetical protein
MVCLIVAVLPAHALPDGAFDYFGAAPPGAEAEIFAPGFVSTQHHDDMFPVISPDGREVILRINGLRDGQPHSVLYATRLGEGGDWSTPRPLPFLTRHRGGGASYAPDGSRLYFTSRRPLPGADPATDKSSLWYAERTDDGWTSARALDSPLNEVHLNGGGGIAADGTMYLSFKAPDRDSHDIHEAVCVDGEYPEYRLLPGRVNSDGQELAPFVDSTRGFMLFTTTTPDGLRIRLSIRQADGRWSEPETVDELTAPEAKFVTMSPDGEYLLFVSHRQTERSNPRATWPIEAFDPTPMDGGADVCWMRCGFLHERVADMKARHGQGPGRR